jgi:predicted regulator of Ras-like GTPase activity (Roadblock/LC7/MglB family)
MSSVQTSPEYASRAARLDRILADLLRQTPGVEAAAVVSFDGLPMASALPDGMDEDRIAAMSAALLSLAERAAQDLNRGDLSQVYIEGEHGTVFLVSAKDEAVLIAVTAAGAKVGMMLYEVKLAANKVGEALQGPTPLPTPLPASLTRGYPDAALATPAAEAAPESAAESAPIEPEPTPEPVGELAEEPAVPAEPALSEPAVTEPTQSEPVYAEATSSEQQDSESRYVDAAYSEPSYSDPGYSSTGYGDASYSDASYAPPTHHEPAPAEPVYAQHSYSDHSYAEPSYGEQAVAEPEYGSPLYDQIVNAAPVTGQHAEPADYFASLPYTGAADSAATFDEPASSTPTPDAEAAEEAPSDRGWYAEQPAETDNGWSSYAPSATVLPGEPTPWN